MAEFGSVDVEWPPIYDKTHWPASARLDFESDGTMFFLKKSVFGAGWALAASAVILVSLSTTVAGQDKKDGPAKPEAVSLETKDGVALNATYLAGNKGKKTVPILMIHGWDGIRADMGPTALALQRRGHAVLLPDLRGHGRSTKATVNGEEVTIEREKMRKGQIEAVAFDLQACKKFLLEKHNKGEVNIELLCLIGADAGAVFALNFAAYDWSKPQLPAFKLGRDVGALVLLSPPASFKGVTSKRATVHPVIRERMSILIAAGKQDRKGFSAAKRLYSGLERARGDEPEAIAERTIFFVEPQTSLSGADLLKGRGLQVADNVAQFIDLRLVQNPDAPEWIERRKPGGSD